MKNPAALTLLAGLVFGSGTAFCQVSDDAASAFTLFKECVQKISEIAYKQESRAVIISKALHGLVGQLGTAYQAQEQDLSRLADGAAEEAFEKALQTISSTPGERHSTRELAETALQAYCQQHDPWSQYIRSEDYKLVKLMSKAQGSGVGISLIERDSACYCFPLPGSPAEAAGIKSGDKLLAVDGKSLGGKPLEFIASLVKGAPGTDVMLRVERTFGRAQTVKVVREAINTSGLLVEKKISGPLLRVRKFNNDLVKETRAALAGLSPGDTITLDFRGCPGGSLEVAIEFASLFMEPGETIVTVRTRGQPDEVHTAQKPREIKVPAIVLLQDEGTASAAELVIAALISSKSNRAASQGAKTFGKGVFQIATGSELRGGGYLRLTAGELIAPQGRTWEGIGLLPSLENRGRIFPKD